MRTSRDKATHALLGIDVDGARGIIHWHDNEFEAHKDAKEINENGGRVTVVKTPNGELSKELSASLHYIIFGR